MDKRLWLKIAAGLSFFMAISQAIIALSPAAAAYFGAPASLLEDRQQMLLVGGGAALIPLIFGFYALSGAGIVRRLPMLRIVLIGISVLFLLRGLLFIPMLLAMLGILEGEIPFQAAASSLVFLAAGLTFAIGTILNWKAMSVRR
jgi:hypothetical protein